MSTVNISHFLHNIRFLVQNLKSSLEIRTKSQEDPAIELQTFSQTSIPFSKDMSPFSQLTLAAGGGGLEMVSTETSRQS
jgi:hypothetical protein